MPKVAKTFTVDSDIIDAIKPLSKKYGINLSEVVNTALFQVLQIATEVESLSVSHPDGLPEVVARTYLKQKISSFADDQQSVVDELYVQPVTKSKTKVKAKA